MAVVPNVMLSAETSKGAVTVAVMEAVLLFANTLTVCTVELPTFTLPKFKEVGVVAIIGVVVVVLTVMSSKARRNISVQLKWRNAI